MKKPILMRNYSLPVFLSLFFFSSSLLGQSCESIGINFATWPDFGFGQANISPDTLYFAPPGTPTPERIHCSQALTR
jgi:hypothetical protein